MMTYKQTKSGRYVRVKPDDLRAHYEEKEQSKLQYMAELEECGKMISNFFARLTQELLQHPNDLPAIERICRDCVQQFKNKLKLRDFQSISKFDIDLLWNNSKKRMFESVDFNREMVNDI